MTKLKTLRDGLVEELKDLYSAEKQLIKALPKIEEKATNLRLKQALSSHVRETEGQVDRLDEIGKLLKVNLTGSTCEAMQGLVKEGSALLEEESENSALIDALLIGAAQRVEHYEMAAYITAHAMAQELGLTDVARLLGETLVEEKAADRMLFSIAKGEVLSEANMEEEDTERETSTGGASKKPRSQKESRPTVRFLGLLACLCVMHQSESIALAETAAMTKSNEEKASTYNSDNTGRNARDRNDSRATADDQNLGGPEIDVLARIRQEIVANDTLSTNGHNVKIVVENGKIVLRGPVKSLEEKNWIQATTARVAPQFNVVNQLEVAPG